MVHKTFYYARVSTREQNLDRQLEAFRALGAADREIITDKESGKNLDRPGYQALKSTMLRSGDTLVVKVARPAQPQQEPTFTASCNGLRKTISISK